MKWNAVIPALKQVIMDTDAAVSWGLKVFPEGEGSECIATSVTPNVVVPVAPMNATNVISAIDSTMALGNGTPTGDAVTAAFNYLKGLTSTNPKYILLATDGAPSCAGDDQGQQHGADVRRLAGHDRGKRLAADRHVRAGRRDQQQQRADDVELPGRCGRAAAPRPADALLPRQLAGGADRRDGVHHRAGGDLHLPAEPAAAGHERLDEARHVLPALGHAPSCTTDCPNGQTCVSSICMLKVPYDGSMGNGWAYTDANDTAVQAYGAWCDQIKASGANTVQIIYGCPLIDVP